MCFIGHRDLLRAMERILRRAQLPVAMSEGFHPKPRVSYLSALPLGFSSLDEAMELILEEDIPAEELQARLNAVTVDGLDFVRVDALDEKCPKQQPAAFEYAMTVPASEREELGGKIAAFLNAESVEVVKANGKTIDARPPVTLLTLEDTDDPALLKLRVVLKAQTGPEAGVREILAALGLDEKLFRTIFPTRVRSYIVDES